MVARWIGGCSAVLVIVAIVSRVQLMVDFDEISDPAQRDKARSLLRSQRRALIATTTVALVYVPVSYYAFIMAHPEKSSARDRPYLPYSALYLLASTGVAAFGALMIKL